MGSRSGATTRVAPTAAMLEDATLVRAIQRMTLIDAPNPFRLDEATDYMRLPCTQRGRIG